MDLPLTALALAMLILFVVELLVPLDATWMTRLAQAQTAIWTVFVVDFVLEFALAPSKTRYLQENWLTAVSVVVPAIRSVRILRVARIFRGLTVLRLVTVLNRGIAAIGHVFERGKFGYVLVLAATVTVTASAGVYFLERGQPGATITTPGEALWWATTIMTTINSHFEAVSLEARLIGLMLRMVALGMSGYVTATIAVYLLGVQTANQAGPGTPVDELRELRSEVHRLTELLQSTGAADSDHNPRHTGTAA